MQKVKKEKKVRKKSLYKVMDGYQKEEFHRRLTSRHGRMSLKADWLLTLAESEKRFEKNSVNSQSEKKKKALPS